MLKGELLAGATVKYTYIYDVPVAFDKRLLMPMYIVDPEPVGRL